MLHCNVSRPAVTRCLATHRLVRRNAQVMRRQGFAESRAVRGANVLSISEWEHPIYASDRVRDRKSVFLAHASTLTSPSALPTFINHLTSLSTLKRATHCMYAYRVIPDLSEPSRKILGQHDGGEKGSGERLSRLLEALECENVVVVVSRWYGGVKLGSDRWKLISGVAKEALNRGSFGKEKVVDTKLSHNSKAKKKKK